jgi:hypothetical protein
MRKLSLALVFLLTGCAGVTTNVSMTWPEVPNELIASCPDLKKLQNGTTKISEVLPVITENYGKYHECQIKVDSWIEWYKTQKEIYNSVK